ncbi:MAG: hypothetical protein J5563_00230 [Clostridia bacterium]|nr:hypothetical protein [Clostridia bacterium]
MKKFILIVAAALLASLFVCMVPAYAAEEIAVPTAAVKPVIDGEVNPGEWRDAARIDVSSIALVGMITNAPTSLLGKGSMFYLMWDEENLYCAAHVINSTKPANQPLGIDNSVSGLGDGFQMILFADSESAWAWDLHKLMWTVCPWTGENGEPVIWEMFCLGENSTVEFPIASTVRDDGYDVEFAIPWISLFEARSAGFLGEYSGEAGDEIFFMICMLDADGNSQNMSITADAWGGAEYCDRMVLSYDEAGGEYADSVEESTAPDVTEPGGSPETQGTAGTGGENTGTPGTQSGKNGDKTNPAVTTEKAADEGKSPLPWILIAAGVVIVAVVVVIIVKKSKKQ